MALKIVRNDITQMQVEAIVNTANWKVTVGAGCDTAIYNAAGYEKLLAYRKQYIGEVSEGNSFITPGFDLYAKYIIHTVSPLFIDGQHGEENTLRNCYKNSFKLVDEHNIKSVAFPLISTGSFGYPKEEGLRIAVDEINAFLIGHSNEEIDVYLVVYDNRATELGMSIYPSLTSYIDSKYAGQRDIVSMNSIPSDANIEPKKTLFGNIFGSISSFGLASRPKNVDIKQSEKSFEGSPMMAKAVEAAMPEAKVLENDKLDVKELESDAPEASAYENDELEYSAYESDAPEASELESDKLKASAYDYDEQVENYESAIKERMLHLSDTFSEYLLYLIKTKGMTNADVYKRAIIDKKAFSKIKNNPNYHPQKITALCLCVGAQLNLDETRDLLARAGYALSPCDKTDIIFSYFIENKIYDMIELDIQLEEYGLKCIIA